MKRRMVLILTLLLGFTFVGLLTAPTLFMGYRATKPIIPVEKFRILAGAIVSHFKMGKQDAHSAE